MKRSIIAALLVVSFTSTLRSQQLKPRPVPTGRVESFTFDSPSMGVRYAVNVGLPEGYQRGGSQKFQALITTDGDLAFRGVFEGANRLSGVIAPLFVVSIGVGEDEGIEAHHRRRTYEFSPYWDLQDPFGEQIVAPVCRQVHSPEGRCVGGAERFLKVIVSELLPLVTAKYPIDTAQLGLFGHSAGAYFVSWVMFQPSSPFRKYLISSPAMAYGDGEIFRTEERYSATHKDLAASVYLAAGALEASDPVLEGIARVVSGMTRFAGTLAARKYPSLLLATEIHPGMGHEDVTSTSVVRGMRTLYSK